MTDSHVPSKPDVPALNAWRLRSYRVATEADATRPLTSRSSVSTKLGPKFDLKYDNANLPLLPRPTSTEGPLSARPATQPLKSRQQQQQQREGRPSTVALQSSRPRASSTARPSSRGTAHRSLNAAPQIQSARVKGWMAKENHPSLGNPGDIAMLEGWLDDLLMKGQQRACPDAPGITAKTSEKYPGLQKAGLDRLSLCALEVTPGAVDRLYRAMYVYSVGFLETVNEAFAHSTSRKELLCTIWNGFLAIAEENLKVGFSSEIAQIAESRLTYLQQIEQLESEVDAVNSLRHETEINLQGAEAKIRVVDQNCATARGDLKVLQHVLAEEQQRAEELNHQIYDPEHGYKERLRKERELRRMTENDLKQYRAVLVTEQRAHDATRTELAAEQERRKYNLLEIEKYKVWLSKERDDVAARKRKILELEKSLTEETARAIRAETDGTGKYEKVSTIEHCTPLSLTLLLRSLGCVSMHAIWSFLCWLNMLMHLVYVDHRAGGRAMRREGSVRDAHAQLWD